MSSFELEERASVEETDTAAAEVNTKDEVRLLSDVNGAVCLGEQPVDDDAGSLDAEYVARPPEIEKVAIIEHKITAEHVAKECPQRLKQIAKEIKHRLSKADKQNQLAQNHLIAVEQLLKEAKCLCDDGGFKKFREVFCPQLEKSQAYAMRAIATGKKTFEQHREEERERKRRARANKKAVVIHSGTVPEKPDPVLEPQGPPDETESQNVICATAKQSGPSTNRQSAINATDNALLDFSARVTELVRLTAKQKIERFAKTSVHTDELSKVGKFLTELAVIKRAAVDKRNKPSDFDAS